MKQLILALLIILLAIPAYAANSSIEEQVESYRAGDLEIVEVVFTIVGDDGNGSIADTAMAFDATGYYLYNVEADPGATKPDAADVLVMTASGRDLLAGGGANLIHADNTQSMSGAMPFFEIVTGVLTLDVDNQGTNSATYTVKLTFIK
uniref:Uncharacterized protein n=1 Tax=viral metagenome TaxID=1070528 RepID=A0A6M3IZS1_9ZZZZ